MAANGFARGRSTTFERADVDGVDHRGAPQAGLPLRPRCFVDPPTFSNSKAMGSRTWDVQRDHVELLIGVSRLLHRGAARPCSRATCARFKPDVEALAQATASRLEDITASDDSPRLRAQPQDPPVLPREARLAPSRKNRPSRLRRAVLPDRIFLLRFFRCPRAPNTRFFPITPPRPAPRVPGKPRLAAMPRDEPKGNGRRRGLWKHGSHRRREAGSSRSWGCWLRWPSPSTCSRCRPPWGCSWPTWGSGRRSEAGS